MCLPETIFASSTATKLAILHLLHILKDKATRHASLILHPLFTRLPNVEDRVFVIEMVRCAFDLKLSRLLQECFDLVILLEFVWNANFLDFGMLFRKCKFEIIF